MEFFARETITPICPLCAKECPNVPPKYSDEWFDEPVTDSNYFLGHHCDGYRVYLETMKNEIESEWKQRVASSSSSSSAAGTSLAAAQQQSQVLAKMRSLVSQEKVRYQENGFDLDLTYITPQVIAMGFPSSGKEAYYRNPVEEVERLLNSKHPGKYRVYNLCSERDYDTPTRFGGQYRRFPFDDHNAPCPIKLIPDFVRDASEYLRQNRENVVAIHCKAGKGRTGVMISCLLRALEPKRFRDAAQALQYFGTVRTNDGKGVTIPSQKRYVGYWDVMLSQCGGREPPLRTIQLKSLRIESTIKVSGVTDVYFIIAEGNREKIDSRKLLPLGARKDATGMTFTLPADLPVNLTGDLKFVVYQRNSFMSDEELMHFWLNTAFCKPVERLTKADNAIDGRASKGKDEVFCKNLAVETTWSGATAAMSIATPAAASGIPKSPTEGSAAMFPPEGTGKGSPEASPRGEALPTCEKDYFRNLFQPNEAA